MLTEAGERVSLSTMKQVLCQLGLKGHTEGKSHYSNSNIKNTLVCKTLNNTKTLMFGNLSGALKLIVLAILTIITFWKKNTMSVVKYRGGSIMPCGNCAAGGTGALRRIDDTMRKEH
ncbi:hypothetical protein AMECASPLE_034212 [Ameca splendens]|uniref:Uncharacterized protein n=1 Tax=Ameca splendens TaxID=208324 RepID=A0ABV1A2G3_9TELE